MRELALFAGAGGGILGGKLLGWRTVCAVELDAYARQVLLARQLDGVLDRFPIWDDIKTFEGRPWRGSVDVVTAGWPCQDISCAGKGEGLDGKRSGLWVEVARILGEVRPRHFLGENSPMLLSNRGWRAVFGDLSALGYRYRWGVIGARHAGAPHKRDRIWILATHADGERRRAKQGSGTGGEDSSKLRDDRKTPWRLTRPSLFRVVDGVANRSHRLRAIGNGQVPAVAALAWRVLGGP